MDDVLRRILRSTELLLLDFDGPLCALFAEVPAPHVADRLRDVLSGGRTRLPPEIEHSPDPFDVLAHAATLGTDEAHRVEAALRASEVDAALLAPPTPDAHNLVRAWHKTGRGLAIVSNNSREAVNTYLHRHFLAQHVHVVSARTGPDPRLLKPSPHLVEAVISTFGTPPGAVTLIGDSASDVVASRGAHAKVIAFANKVHKRRTLREAAPDLVVTALHDAVDCARDLGPWRESAPRTGDCWECSRKI
ncbi:HAD family hydrolase [Saccharothrix obliqua]|uniref:HAD family hydrolase n=1 Tax=Saccharothrix obliqua TaxID=2861747 RepID=UPI001C5D2336|nr:HAD hydrolase-like protein [Saccharothrix obliqua]MBW4719643.1 HAD hydrolase-like protein [Saccharothrix obliqua]